ncbi:MAG: inositol monophosphatase family protein [Acidimicrobiales bacterium]
MTDSRADIRADSRADTTSGHGDPFELLRLAVRAAEAAGELLLEGISRSRTNVATKTTATDMVTEMDLAAEALVVATVLAERPGDAFLAEEGSAPTPPAGAPVTWVVDPLDGTTNYLYGFPSWAVSIAAEVDGAAVAGVVYDPTHGEVFTGVAGQGAWCNTHPLRLGPPPVLPSALVATGFGYDPGRRAEQAATLACVLPTVRDVRRAGAASLDLCWVAAGRVDAYYERGLQPWDWAAGTLIAAEAGATLSTLPDGTMVAAAVPLHQSLVELLLACGCHQAAG